MAHLRANLFSLQMKLVVAMTALIVLAVIATGVVFVLRSKGERERQVLERVAATAPIAFQRALPEGWPLPPGPGQALQAFQASTVGPDLDQVASERDVRILLIGDKGTVVHDTAGGLQGITVTYPAPRPEDLRRGYFAWQAGIMANNLTFVAPTSAISVAAQPATAGGFIYQAAPVAPSNFGIVVAVPTRRIENAWLSALPGVGIAGAIAVPFAVIAAVLLARQIARPIHELTLASEAMAQGEFDQRVEVSRDDEVGRLATAFSRMATRVGERDSQMRSLLANVSHDLKTPLTSILGYAQALTDGVVDQDSLPRVAGVIRDQAQRTNLLLADLLYLSELDAGQVLRVTADMPLRELVAEAVERIQPAADQKSLLVETSVVDGICSQIDGERVVRALTNVLDNAVRFSPAGATVDVETRVEDGCAVLEVRNSGPRIAEDDLPLIFERFYRDQRHGGHGLGLAIARETLEQNGGEISARNQADGVVFTLHVPAR